MSMLFRVMFVFVLLYIGLGPSGIERASAGGGDIALLRTASLRMANGSLRHTIRWLNRRPLVARASAGLDGRTLSISFRDGMKADILPRRGDEVPLSGARTTYRMRRRIPVGARAAVLEPFATELGMGPHAGDPEVNDLQQAGFAVDQAYDTAVTVSMLKTLSSYNVVYMHAHSGVDASGRGILATGELANGDPTVQPYLADGTVVVVGVAGSSQNYYAITSGFIRTHVGRFANSSLLFLNGCALLASNDFWQALSAQGAGVLISWDRNAQNQDDYLSAAAFFNQMNGGLSVAGTLQTLYNAGYGTSTDSGQKATLGYLGDGTITLARTSGGTITPPATTTPIPTVTPTRTAVPTATRTPRPTSTATRVPTRTATSIPTATRTSTPTNTPLPTATSTPHVPLDARLRPSVSPGSRQTISIEFKPDMRVAYQVRFPNGDIRQGQGQTDNSGHASLSYKQPASKITRTRKRAVVSLTSGGASWSGSYAIGFGKIDVSVLPRHQSPGKNVTVWVHTRAREDLTITVKAPGHLHTLHARTGTHGWAKKVWSVPRHQRPAALIVRADARLPHREVHSATKLTIG